MTSTGSRCRLCPYGSRETEPCPTSYFCCIASIVLVTASTRSSPRSMSDSPSWKIGPQTGISLLPCAEGPFCFPSIDIFHLLKGKSSTVLARNRGQVGCSVPESNSRRAVSPSINTMTRGAILAVDFFTFNGIAHVCGLPSPFEPANMASAYDTGANQRIDLACVSI